MKANINDGWLAGEHAATLLVKMQPSESEIYADLLLTLNQADFANNKQTIISLERGDQFAFNATLIKVADEESIHHLHAHQMLKIDGHLEIPYEMGNNYRHSAFKPSVEIISIVDKHVVTDHEHVHLYNETFNQTAD